DPEVRVGIVRSKTAARMLITQAVQDFGAGETEVFQEIAGVIGQAASMRVHIADSDLMRNPRIEHDESRMELVEPGVPGDFAVANEGGDDGSADRFETEAS